MSFDERRIDALKDLTPYGLVFVLGQFEGDTGAVRLAHLTQAAMSLGVGQLQWNVTTAERLERAQEDPERYGNIAVRVAGYSQMFRLIDRELQDHIIARTKHRQ